MSPTYYQSVCEHTKTALAYLDQYAARVEELQERDFFAIDRLLQIIVESGIGLSKRMVKSKGWPVLADAVKNFEKLKEEGVLTAKELLEWKKAIGMRNVLVHDYLNVDRKIIRQVLQDRAYHLIKSLLAEAKPLLT